jgi:galactofuranosylgalactofuranosylrhamnosyl-N-acetylglucosaminyl-diphospho-decaprenol beta-1,5/1,6-galactofuranosyltransferase
LYLDGDFFISIMARTPEGKEFLIKEYHCEGCVSSRPLSFLIRRPPMTKLRIYPVLRALAENSVLNGGGYDTSISFPPIRLGVVICTYHRENAVLSNLLKLFHDPALKDVQIVVVDNGCTLYSANLPKGVHLVPHANWGGAGGFSRGIWELASKGFCSHVLLMDDDVLLDTESVARSIKFFSLTPDCTLAGALFSMDQPAMMLEAGAALHKTKPLVVIPNLSNLNIDKAQALDMWQSKRETHYGGFWFFGFPMAAAKNLGLLLPFFLKGDDVEFGLRLRRLSIPIYFQAGVGVHHPGFTDTFNLVKRYYWVRNMLIVSILYTRPQCRIIRELFLEVLKETRARRLGFLLALACGVEDFLKGPKWLANADDRQLMASLKNYNLTQKRNTLFVRNIAAIAKLLWSIRKIKAQWHSASKTLSSFEFWKNRKQ